MKITRKDSVMTDFAMLSIGIAEIECGSESGFSGIFVKDKTSVFLPAIAAEKKDKFIFGAVPVHRFHPERNGPFCGGDFFRTWNCQRGICQFKSMSANALNELRFSLQCFIGQTCLAVEIELRDRFRCEQSPDTSQTKI